MDIVNKEIILMHTISGDTLILENVRQLVEYDLIIPTKRMPRLLALGFHTESVVFFDLRYNFNIKINSISNYGDGTLNHGESNLLEWHLFYPDVKAMLIEKYPFLK